MLELLALGHSYNDIAQTLIVTQNTVKTHLTNIYRKFGVQRRHDALQLARHHGLIANPLDHRRVERS